MHKLNKSFFLSLCCFSQILCAQDSSTLDSGIKDLNDGVSGTLSLSEDFNLTEQVRAVNADEGFQYLGKDLLITGPFSGGSVSLKGNGGNLRGLFIGGEGSSATGFVIINNITFDGFAVQGGSGASGGMGAGGALFIGQNVVVNLTNCAFTNCTATGGSARVGSGGVSVGGGGGMRGDGLLRTSSSTQDGFGGGGFGGSGSISGGGASGFSDGNASGNTPGGNFDGVTSPVGGPGIGGGVVFATADGGFGGGGGQTGTSGGLGGFGGGGGGSDLDTSFAFASANGGFGGGGGNGSGLNNGRGGFGAGSGINGSFPQGNPTGFGGGEATFSSNFSSGVGGKGAGFGGAIFVMDGAEVTFTGSLLFENNLAQPGLQGNSSLDPVAGFGTLGNDIFAMSSSHLIFSIQENVLLQNPIQGDQGAGGGSTSTGGLTLTAPGRTLTLAGDNTYTGITTVNTGTLLINGSVLTDIEVLSGGTLGGNFVTTGGITNDGLVLLRGMAGEESIQMSGVYSQSSTGNLSVDITPNGFTNTIMGATSADLAGTLTIGVREGNYVAGTTVLVIDAPTNGTTFDTIVKMGDFADEVDVQIAYGSVTATYGNNRLFTHQEIDSGTSTSVADAIVDTQVAPNSDFAFAVELLGTLDNKQVNKALDVLSANMYSSIEWINARNNSYVADILSQHLFELCCSPRDCCSDCNSNVWVSVFGNIMNNQKRLDNLRRYNADSVGVVLGADTCCSPCFTFGGALGYTRTSILWRNGLGGGDSDSYYAALYGSWESFCCINADFSVLGGGSFFDMKRNIQFSRLDRSAESDFWGYFFTAHLGLSRKWLICCNILEPFASVDYHFFNHEKFTEKGADSLNLIVFNKDQHMMRGEVGLTWRYEMDCGCYCYSPYIGVSWVGEFPLNASKVSTRFTRHGNSFRTKSYDSSVQLGSPQAGIKLSHCNGVSFLLGYKGLYNGSVRINEVEGRVEWIF